MSLSDLASLGSFVSGLAVLISLVYLALQVRQAEKNQQAAIRQAAATRMVEYLMSAAAEPSLAETIGHGARGTEDMSEVALRQYSLFCRASFYSWQDSFHQHHDGLLSDAAFRSLEISLKNAVAGSIGMRTQWRIHRIIFDEDFVRWVDSLMVATPARQPTSTITQWKSALSAERAGASY